MSAETAAWLNNNCLIGFTDQRGYAWHYDKNLQGNESNHYPGAIPVADVERRLFHWDAVESKATYMVGDRSYELPGVVLARSDTGAYLGQFAGEGQGHGYREWLLDKVGGLVDTAKNDLGIASALTLMGGAVAAVQIELPDNVVIGGDTLRPFIVAMTSFNQKYVTSYMRGTGRVVCDNTLSEFHQNADAIHRIKHTKKSHAKLDEVRSTLDIMFEHQAAELLEIEALMNQVVTDEQFAKIMNMVDGPSATNKDRGITRIENRQAEYLTLWNHDGRVGDYKNTAWGVINTFNTYNQHKATIRKTTVRPEANMLNFIGGKTAANDAKVRQAIKVVVGV